MGRPTKTRAPPAPSLEALLPASADAEVDFGSPAFWDAFFEARGADNAFEWYGDWRQLAPLVRPFFRPRAPPPGSAAAPTPPRALVLGCGNSALSAQVHDDPLATRDVVSIDTCARAIKGQLGLHARARPACKWRVADMTATPFPPASFDVLLDKGGLDALHAEDSASAGAAAAAAVAEAVRLTAPGGAYVVVSLCEPHVLASLLSGLRCPAWSVHVAAPPPPPDMAGAALQPLVVLASRGGGEGGSPATTAPPVACGLLPLPPPPGPPNAAQLAGVASVVAAENAARARGERAGEAGGGAGGGGGADPWAALSPGRVAPALLLGPRPSASTPPRFSATVVDAPPAPPSKASPPPPTAAVFLVPQGREHEWLFSDGGGLQALRAQVGTDRLVAVRLGRGHAFPGGLPAIQAELGPVVAHLAPAALRGVARAVPILTLGGEAGLGWRARVAALPSPVSGDILVEDVAPPDAAAAAAAGIVGFRTLVFGGAAGLVQSEAALVAAAGAAKKKGGGGGGGGGGGPQHHGGTPLAGTHLPAAYHTAILAGVALAMPAIVEGAACSGAAPAALVVGVGGGGLGAHLAGALRFAVATVDLDPAVLAAARAHFGLQAAEDRLGPALLAVSVGDGVDAVAAAARGSLALCVVDAGGGGGAGHAMSCPPPPFTADAFVASAAAALHPACGLLAVNCVCRAGGPVEALVEKLKVGVGGRHGGEERGGVCGGGEKRVRRGCERAPGESGARDKEESPPPPSPHHTHPHSLSGSLPHRPRGRRPRRRQPGPAGIHERGRGRATAQGRRRRRAGPGGRAGGVGRGGGGVHGSGRVRRWADLGGPGPRDEGEVERGVGARIREGALKVLWVERPISSDNSTWEGARAPHVCASSRLSVSCCRGEHHAPSSHAMSASNGAPPPPPSFPLVDAFFADCGSPGASETEAAVKAFVARHSDANGGSTMGKSGAWKLVGVEGAGG